MTEAEIEKFREQVQRVFDNMERVVKVVADAYNQRLEEIARIIKVAQVK